MKIAACIATTGRPEILSHTIACLVNQSRPPDVIAISAPDVSDFPQDFPGSDEIRRIRGPKCLTKQRNSILHAINDMDVAIFLDDDFFALENYIEEAEKLMDENSDIAVVTGALIADGARSSGISIDQGHELLIVCSAN